MKFILTITCLLSLYLTYGQNSDTLNVEYKNGKQLRFIYDFDDPTYVPKTTIGGGVFIGTTDYFDGVFVNLSLNQSINKKMGVSLVANRMISSFEGGKEKFQDISVLGNYAIKSVVKIKDKSFHLGGSNDTAYYVSLPVKRLRKFSLAAGPALTFVNYGSNSLSTSSGIPDEMIAGYSMPTFIGGIGYTSSRNTQIRTLNTTAATIRVIRMLRFFAGIEYGFGTSLNSVKQKNIDQAVFSSSNIGYLYRLEWLTGFKKKDLFFRIALENRIYPSIWEDDQSNKRYMTISGFGLFSFGLAKGIQ